MERRVSLPPSFAWEHYADFHSALRPAPASGTVSPAETSTTEVAPKPKLQGKGRKDWKTSRSIKTHTLTESDIANGHSYSIFDVVMPIPGFDVDLPGGKLRDMYTQILTADGLDIEGSWKRQK